MRACPCPPRIAQSGGAFLAYSPGALADLAAVGRVAMKVLALSVAIVALTAVSAEAQRPNCKDNYIHYSSPGQADQGATVALPNGGFQTTYADGWTHTSEPDSSYGAG